MPIWASQALLQILAKYVLTPENIVAARTHIIAFLKKQVANTSNRVDDQVVEIVAEALAGACKEAKK